MSARGNTFNVVSHNTQGFSGSALQGHMQSLATGKADVVALQESGQIPLKQRKQVKPGLFTSVIRRSGGERRTRVSAPEVYVAFAEATGSKQKNTRCSLALYSKVKPMRVGILESGKKGVRPMLYAEFDDKFVANVHLPSGRPAFAQKVLGGFMHQLKDAGMLDKPEHVVAARIATRRVMRKAMGHVSPVVARKRSKAFVLTGDMNMSGARLKQTVAPFKLDVFSPKGATQESGGTLDHAAVRGASVSAMRTQHGSSDHSAVSFSVKR